MILKTSNLPKQKKPKKQRNNRTKQSQIRLPSLFFSVWHF